MLKMTTGPEMGSDRLYQAPLFRCVDDALPPGQVIYIAGPMRGIEDDNFAAFNGVADHLTARSFKVRNPASKGHLNDRYTWRDAMAVDIGWLLEASAICLLPGWEQSEGARLEVAIATALGLEFFQAVNIPTGNGEADWGHRRINTPASDTVDGIDAEARRLVYGARASTYGHPRQDFDLIGKLWSALLGIEIDAEHVALMMIALKMARLNKSPEHHDSQVDVIGYALCLKRLQEGPTEIAKWEAEEVS